MGQYIGRHIDLKNKMNRHLSKLTGQDKDFFSFLKTSDFFELKSVLADINNVLTLKMTEEATEWICNYFQLADSSKEKILKTVYEAKPNTNGYDIFITEPIKFIAEVKCINPFNNGDRYGAAQWDGILDDALKLKRGKKQLNDTSNFYKFLFLADLGERTDNAITELLRTQKPNSQNQIRLARHEIKKDIELLDSVTVDKLTTTKIYFKKLKVE